MKIYSEILKKFYDSTEDCLQAEKEFNEKKTALEEEKKAKALAVSKEKKELASAVEEAENKLEKAYQEYEIAKEEAKKILEESNQKVLDIINPAKENVKVAQKERYNAISEFNKKFGLYTTTYSGDKAFNELKRMSTWIDSLFYDHLW